MKKALPFLFLAATLVGCAAGESGDMSDAEKIKKASSGRDAQMGQESGKPPAEAGK